MKSYQLSIQEKPGYLHFQVSGENNLETVQSYLEEVLQRCIEQKYSSVLIEEFLQGPGLKVIEMFQIAEKSSDISNHLRRVAYVDTNMEHSFANLKFAGTVASNRGLNVHIFPSVPDAEQWLHENANGHYVRN